MKALIISAMLLSANLVYAQDNVQPPFTADTAYYTDMVCPYGHQSVKAVPILYGLIKTIDSTKQKAIDNYELVLGGCIVSENSPKHRFICTRCGFTLLTNFMDGTPAGWHRQSGDKKSFEIPLNNLIADFPVINSYRAAYSTYSSPTYIQEVGLKRESRTFLAYYSTTEITEFEKILFNYAESKNIKIIKEQINKELKNRMDYISKDSSIYFGISLTKILPAAEKENELTLIHVLYKSKR